MQEIAVVTGGNRGIGLGVAKLLAASGKRVILTARELEQGRAAAAEVGDRAEARALDVTDAGSIAQLAAGLREEPGAVHVLVNNAGASLDGFDAGVARQTLEVNTFGAVRVTDAVLPLVPRGGRIVMVSSGMGDLAAFGDGLRARFLDPALTREALTELLESFVDAVAGGTPEAQGWPRNAYRVSKAGLNAFTRLIAREVADRGIIVNAAGPGWVRTRMGGAHAPRSVEEGARSVVLAAELPPDGPTGQLFRDGRRISF